MRNCCLLLLLVLLVACQKMDSPPVQVVEVTEVSIITTATTAIGRCAFTCNSEIVEAGMLWGKDSTAIEYMPGTILHGNVAVRLEGLKGNTTYYYSFLFRNARDCYSTNVEQFVTGDYVLPLLTIPTISNVVGNAANVSAQLMNTDAIPLLSQGFVFTTDTNGSITTTYTGSDFIATISGLNVSTCYYIAAFAQNEAGIARSGFVSFETSDGKPRVMTGGIAPLSANKVQCTGVITSDEGFPIAECGVCWDTLPNPSTTGLHTSGGANTGTFTCVIGGILSGVDYYVRAYAVNANGITYGQQVQFKINESEK